MNVPFPSWILLSYAPMRRHVMDEIAIFSGRSERHALQVLQPGFPHNVPPEKSVPNSPIDVPVSDPKDVPPYDPKDEPPHEPKDVPPPEPRQIPPVELPQSTPKDRLGEFRSGPQPY